MDVVDEPVDVRGNDPPVAVVVKEMDLALQWIVFENEQATRERVQVEGFGTFEDLATMKEKDIMDLAESYGRRTIGDGRFVFGIRRVGLRIGLVHWVVQDFARVDKTPSILGYMRGPSEVSIRFGDWLHCSVLTSGKWKVTSRIP
jgi:hypothetical protein